MTTQADAFTLCFNTSTIRPTGLLDKIRIAGEAGFAAIELWHNDLDAHLAGGGTLADVRRALDDAGLECPDTVHITGWLDPDLEGYRRTLDDARRKFEQAAALGVPRVIAGPGRWGDDLALAAERYRALLELGREYGVLPAVEFIGWAPHLNTIAKAWQVVEAAGDPDGAVILDSFHIFRGGSQPDDIRRLTGDRIVNFHINDAPATKPREQQVDMDRVLPGDGVIPLRAMLAALQDIGYRGPLSLELFNPSLWEQDPLEVARTGRAKLDSLLAQ